MKARRATVVRNTRETRIRVGFNADGRGRFTVDTSIPFLSHMLELFAKHGWFDLTVRASGDTGVDQHHLVEDLGLALGEAVREALGDRRGMVRFASAEAPMDETLGRVSVDLSGRPYLVWRVRFPKRGAREGFEHALLEDFFQAFATRAGANLHIEVPYGAAVHHISEAVFKAFGRALARAVERHPRSSGIPSTKGRW